jgi:ATP-dependent Lhr-like helicase
VALRTGDTPQQERRAQAKAPAEVLVTTPESLYLILGSQQQATLATVHTVIVDEIHALVATKRGAHLALSLERLASGAESDPQRVGLSATARPLPVVARYLGGDRPVAVVDAPQAPNLDLQITVPVEDMVRPALPADPSSIDSVADRFSVARSPSGSLLGELPLREGSQPAAGLWPTVYPRLLALIKDHRTTLIFVNSRGLCERLCNRLNELAGDELVRAHHGSLAHEQRKAVEQALKLGHIRAIVATSSLELGIDMGTLDLVVMVESPGAVSRGLQRVGRAGHQVGETSVGRVFPKHQADLLESAVVVRGMMAGEVEDLTIPHNPLDVLAQQIVALSAVRPISVSAIEALVTRAANYQSLSRDMLRAVLDMLAGHYPSTEFADLRPRIIWDHERDVVRATGGGARLAAVSGGTIPDRGQYRVQLGERGARLGELDEEMVHELRPGQTITLGASTWRVSRITRDRVQVQPAPGEIGKLPFWRGEGPGRPVPLGRRIGAFVRSLAGQLNAAGERRLQKAYALDRRAARNLIAYLREQREATGTLPTDRTLTVERFRDELGDWRVCILSPFGARIHAPWALAIESQLATAAGFEVQTLWSNDGIVLRVADAESPPDTGSLVPDPDEVEDLVVAQLGNSALFASAFRENAARALLLPRRRPGARTPLWAQRLKAQHLLAVARRYPAFPIMLETYRSCLQDIFDLPGLINLLRAIRNREVRVEEVETPVASPFARSLAYAYAAAYLYQGDMPLAERRAQALTLDRQMLRDLLGQEELRELLDAEVVAAVEHELQCRADGFRARNVEDLHDLLRRVGDLSLEQVRERCDADPESWLMELSGSARAYPVRVVEELRWVAADDVALYRDALGCVPPAGVAEVFLQPRDRPMEQLVVRYARTHGPFVTADVAARFRLSPTQAETLLAGLVSTGRLLHGEFHPQGLQHEWCDPDVLRRLRRRTLGRLRGAVTAVEARVFARFLPQWHGVGAERGNGPRLDEVLQQLEGVPLAFSELERAILPARLPQFEPRQLDERGALGQLVWVGLEPLGEHDGRVMLYRRERVGLLREMPTVPDGLPPLALAVLEQLETRGASFFRELVVACGSPPEGELLGTLWDLVWAGLVTNDTFQPLRALLEPNRRRAAHSQLLRRSAGRWSLVKGLLSEPPDFARGAQARILMLLERYGIVSREVVRAEGLSGGFEALYPVLRAMEEAGRLRRGYFIEGLTGAQFAFPGAVDRLRSAGAPVGKCSLALLAATDPANVYGSLLPWPALTSSAGSRPRRKVGAVVALIGGVPVLYLDRRGDLLTFKVVQERELVLRAAKALAQIAATRRPRMLRIQSVDGEPAASSQWTEVLALADFRRDPKGMILEVPWEIGERAGG